jgi:hypothetical protein
VGGRGRAAGHRQLGRAALLHSQAARPSGQRPAALPSAHAPTRALPPRVPPRPPARRQYLEWREKQYDRRELVDIFSRDGAPLVRGALCYIATDSPANVNWLGPAPLPDIAAQVGAGAGLQRRGGGARGTCARQQLCPAACPPTRARPSCARPGLPVQTPAQIAASAGPSGPNCEYVYKLADVMRGMGVVDEELFWLEAEVRRLVPARGQPQAQQQGRPPPAAAAAAAAAVDEPGGGGGKASAGAGAVALEAVASGIAAAAPAAPDV